MISDKDKKLSSRAFVLQNCFVRVPEVKAASAPVQPDVYVSLDHKTDFLTGYSEAYVAKEYPINSETVTSYAAGVDYKRDLSAAMNSPRPNLGDIRAVQSSASDMSAFRSMLDNQQKELERIRSLLLEKQKVNEGGDNNGK